MIDDDVQHVLSSSARLVVVEAPAGCGKTFLGARYAQQAAGRIGSARVLTLTHTNAARDVFATRTQAAQGKVEVRTIDSLIVEISGAYHRPLGLPLDTATWARKEKEGYSQLAAKVAQLLHASPIVATALAVRYPVIICDEHQDASIDQHAVIIALRRAGSLVRLFGDPMQRIYGSRTKTNSQADTARWEGLRRSADACCELETPWRWRNGAISLGRWILAARATLQNGGRIDLRDNLPPGLSVITAENRSRKKWGGYVVSAEQAKAIYSLVNKSKSLLVLASQNETVNSLRSLFNRRLPIWEGHIRESLSALIDAVQTYKGNPAEITRATTQFLQDVTTGFSNSKYADILLQEVMDGCTGKRSKMPAVLQALGRILLEQPDHKGVAKVLRRLTELIKHDTSFSDIKVDYVRELWDAIKLGDFDDPDDGFAAIANHRTHLRPAPPSKAISTVHKAKGLESREVLVLPCDAKHFSDTPQARCRLYVALSRATDRLALVVSRENPSPLLLT